MVTPNSLGGMLQKNYSGINPGSSRLAETMLSNNEPVTGNSNVVTKRKRKRLADTVSSVRNGVARNSGQSEENL